MFLPGRSQHETNYLLVDPGSLSIKEADPAVRLSRETFPFVARQVTCRTFRRLPQKTLL